jgi:hypothetical protein
VHFLHCPANWEVTPKPANMGVLSVFASLPILLTISLHLHPPAELTEYIALKSLLWQRQPFSLFNKSAFDNLILHSIFIGLPPQIHLQLPRTSASF